MDREILKFVILVTIGFCIGIGISLIIEEDQKEKRVVKYDTILIPDTIPQIIEVTGTKYNAVEEQTDATPYNTADGSFIDTLKLRNGEIRWVTLSQDLLWFNDGPFKWGDSLFAFDRNPTIFGWWEVHDAMNSRYKRRIDFLQPVGARDITGQNRQILISKMKFYE